MVTNKKRENAALAAFSLAPYRLSVVAAATEDYDYGKDDDPGAVVVKDVA